MSALDLCFGIFFLVGFIGCLVAIPFVHWSIENRIRALELSDQLEVARMKMIMEDMRRGCARDPRGVRARMSIPIGEDGVMCDAEGP